MDNVANDKGGDSLLEVSNISHQYQNRNQWFRKTQPTQVLKQISFTLEKGYCLGLLGMSGAGKSTLGNIILGLEKPVEGQILFEGQDIYRLDSQARHQIRRDLQVVFQDCYSAVNPLMTAAQIIGEPLDNYEKLTPVEHKQRVAELLEQVGLRVEDGSKRPHQFSGGQLQRINIARAIALNPKLIVLDESVSSLDMVNQGQILSLLAELKKNYQLSYLFVTHDIRAALTICDRIMVLDQGELVYQGYGDHSIMESKHPAVQQLVHAILPEHPSERIRFQHP